MTQPSFQDVFKPLLKALSGSANLPLRAFDGLFPQMSQVDQCYIKISDDSAPELEGLYRVIDLYCQAPSCHCHKVSLLFMDKYQKIYATISYGWKSKTFCRKWELDSRPLKTRFQKVGNHEET